MSNRFSGFEEINITPIPNRLIEELMWSLSSSELKLLLFLFHFQALNEDRAIPGNIIGETFLTKGFPASELRTTLEDLKKKGIIKEKVVESGGKAYFLNISQKKTLPPKEEEEAVSSIDIASRLRSDLAKDLEEVGGNTPRKREIKGEISPKKRSSPNLSEKMAEKGKKTWEKILAEVAQMLDAFTFNQWLKPTRYFGFREGIHLIEVPNPSFYHWFEEEYEDTLNEVVKKVDPEFRYRFISKEETTQLREEL
ncbi:MAG: hypothetical protein J7L64_01215 [Acidobacteria bacterium]|nr:hypothetical protein [Acidobacteriota bacterium]